MFTLVALISGNGSNLQAIINAIAEQQLSAKLLAVISDKADAYGLQRAQAADIPTHSLLPEAYSNREDYEQHLLTLLDQYTPDLIILAGFMRILGKKIVNAYPQKIINIHPSLLPAYPGLHTHQRVLEAGEKEHGCTIHWVTEALDTGPMIAQAKFAIYSNDTVASLKKRVQQLEHILYPLAISWIEGSLKTTTT